MNLGQTRSDKQTKRKARKLQSAKSEPSFKQINRPAKATKPVLKVKLHKAEIPWKMYRKRTSTDESTELIRKVTGLLNKLTSNNFDKLAKQFADLNIDTVDKLVKLVELIFNRIIDELTFLKMEFELEYAARLCSVYTKLCNHLINIQVQGEGDNQIKFLDLLSERLVEYRERDQHIGTSERDQQLETGICCLIRNVVELRNNGWTK